jgi:RNA polymerase sigma factor (sigma-70 family)
LDDGTLLRQYVCGGSHEAFAALVERYADLVWASAMRQVHGDPHSAEDVAQTVFTALATKARRMSAGVVLGGWLITATRFAAADLLKAERRRKHHERKAAMRTDDQQRGGIRGPTQQQDRDQEWAKVGPVLDEALGHLGEALRLAVVLRFFERKSIREVAGRLGVSEDAARQRVCRGLDKLRDLLNRQSVSLPAATLAALLTERAVEAAPAGVAHTLACSASAASAIAASGLAPAGSGWLLSLTKVSAAVSILTVLLGTAGVVVAWEFAGRRSEETVLLAAPPTGPADAGTIAAGRRGERFSFSVSPDASAGSPQPHGDYKSLSIILDAAGPGSPKVARIEVPPPAAKGAGAEAPTVPGN